MMAFLVELFVWGIVSLGGGDDALTQVVIQGYLAECDLLIVEVDHVFKLSLGLLLCRVHRGERCSSQWTVLAAAVVEEFLVAFPLDFYLFHGLHLLFVE